jgi:geranylgeranyl reductase family protein
VTSGETWDLVVVGAGPAGAVTALAARRADPDLRVLLLDRSAFPRDKACGDGIAPQVLDVLASLGVTGLVDDRTPVSELRLTRGPATVARSMARPAYVVPRRVFDARLVTAAVDAGVVLRQHRLRALTSGRSGVVLDDGAVTARVLVGADGAHSAVARALGIRPPRRAFALRGYAPVSDGRRGAQVIAFGSHAQPSYAWSFDRGDGLANVGYGEGPGSGCDRPTRAAYLARLEELLPGSTTDGQGWCAHPLPLSTARPLRPARGAVLLVGDAAGLVNPLTGEGIFYAVATGALAGAAAARAVRRDEQPARPYQRDVRALLGGHLRHTALAAGLARSPRVLDAGIAAASGDQAAFDDLVELGLARGRLTGPVLRGLASHLTRPRVLQKAS